MLADNMKAYEYFKYLIEVNNTNPLEAFKEVLEFIKVNDNKIHETKQEVINEYENKLQWSEITSMRATAIMINDIANQLEEELVGYVEDELDDVGVDYFEVEPYEKGVCPDCDEIGGYCYECIEDIKLSVQEEMRELYGDDVEVLDIKFIDEDE